MTYLLYCIMRNSTPPPESIPAGAGGTPISYISCNGLSAAVSAGLQQDLSPDVPRLVAYGEVIAAFHRAGAVIPMRYGSVLEDTSRGRQLLEENYARYSALLDVLAGCVEMGIRILPEAGAACLPLQPARRMPAQLSSGAAPDSGRAWLAERKNYYAAGEQRAEAARAILARCCRAFNGLYRKCSIDPLPAAALHHAGASILSIYFLVPQCHTEKFCAEFREMSSRETVKLLLSGPWPPYNFAVTDENPDLPSVPS
jgi:hypothetical protein